MDTVEHVIYNSYKDRDSKANLVVLFDFGFEDIVFYSDDGYGHQN